MRMRKALKTLEKGQNLKTTEWRVIVGAYNISEDLPTTEDKNSNRSNTVLLLLPFSAIDNNNEFAMKYDVFTLWIRSYDRGSQSDK